MAAELLTVELCAPEKELLELQADEVMIPGEDGVFTVYPGHTPFLTTMMPGALVLRDAGDNEQFFAVHGGFAEIKDNKIIILADSYETSEDIDTARAESALDRAQERLRKPPEDIDWTRSESALARAFARLHASKRSGYQ